MTITPHIQLRSDARRLRSLVRHLAEPAAGLLLVALVAAGWLVFFTLAPFDLTLRLR